jgi:phage recombination protein Bet
MSSLVTTENSTALVVAEDRPLAWYRGGIDYLKEIIAKDCTDIELSLFAQVCRDQGLNPFSRQIYAIVRGTGKDRKMTIQIAIDGLRLIASRSNKYAGQTLPLFARKPEGDEGPKWREIWVPESKEDFPYACKIGVYHQDFKEPLYVVANFWSYVALGYNNGGKPIAQWAKMPEVMIAKVAEALALRKAFPQETMGMLTAEEMEQASNGERPPYDPKFSDLPANQRADYERKIWSLAKEILGADRLEEKLFSMATREGLIDLDERGKPDLLGTQWKKVEALIERLDAAVRKKRNAPKPAPEPAPEPEEIQDAEIVETPKPKPKKAKAETTAETTVGEVSLLMEIEKLEIELSGIQKPENRRGWYLQQVEEIEQTESRGDWLGPVNAKGPDWTHWTDENYQGWLNWLRGQK